MTSVQLAKKYFKTSVVWKNVFGFIVLHLFFFYGWYIALSGQAKWQTIFISILLGFHANLAITMGAHRLWAHKCYKVTFPLKIFLLIGQTMAGQNSVYIWVRDHRLHHKYSDTDSDPHNSKRGFFFCHMGWLMMKKHPDVVAKGKETDMSDLKADPWIMFQYKYYTPLYLFFAIFVPTALPVLLCGESWWISLFVAYFAKYALILHFTWCVNSVAHFYGTRPYTRDIVPVDTKLVSILTSGEGWHNYHHTFPWDYRAAELGRSFNFTKDLIDLLAKYGMIYELRLATQEMVAHRVKKRGDGSHPLSQMNMESSEKKPDLEIDENGLFGEKYLLKKQYLIKNKLNLFL